MPEADPVAVFGMGAVGTLLATKIHDTAAAASLFAGRALAVETAADFRTAEWEKLLSNVTANPLTALTGHDAEDHRQLIRQAQAEARSGNGPGCRFLPAGQRPRAAEGGA